MSEHAAPSSAYTSRIVGLPTGLVGTVRFRLVDDDATADDPVYGPSTAGIIEDPTGSGSYLFRGTAPASAGKYARLWDTGVGTALVADEDLIVTYSASASLPAANEYVTVSELKATLGLTGQTYADDDIALAVTAASRAIDNECGRRFYADTDATQVRYYTPLNGDLMQVDDLVTLTSLETDPGGDGTWEELWTLNTDFTLKPANAVADGKPYTLIAMHPSGRYSFSTSYPRTIKVTGQFGWPAVPSEVKMAASILATALLKRAREAPFGVVALGVDTAARIAKTDPHLALLLGPYRKWRALR